jgi:hypothetical protein
MLQRKGIVVAGICVVVAIQMAAAVAAGAFSATPAARTMIGRMRTAARKLIAVRAKRGGDLVYCLPVPAGWTYAPEFGCSARARVTEEYELSHGRIERIIGQVTAAHRPTLTYVVDRSGWYRLAAGSARWTRTSSGFAAALLVDYPLPGERVSISKQTEKLVVLHAVSKPDGYEVSDYVNPKTLFDYRDVEVMHVKGKVYRVFDRSRPLHKQSPRPATTPACP